VADLAIAKTRAGGFIQGQAGAQYTMTVSNVGVVPSRNVWDQTQHASANRLVQAMTKERQALDVAQQGDRRRTGSAGSEST